MMGSLKDDESKASTKKLFSELGDEKVGTGLLGTPTLLEGLTIAKTAGNASY